MNKHSLVILLLLSGLSACAQLSPGTQKKLEATQSSIKQEHYQQSIKQEQWQVGQWSLYKTSLISREGVFRLFDSSQKKGFVQILVAAAEGDSFWLELRIVSNDKEQYVAALIAEELIAGDLKYKIKQLKINDKQNTRNFTQAELLEGEAEEQQSEINIWLNFILHSAHEGPHRNADLPAGEFLSVREVPITMSLWIGQMSGYIWYHNAVPIFPVAKFELTTSSTQWTSIMETAELVDFGRSGQKSYFSYE